MSALLPIADHGNLVSVLPFVVPMVVMVAGLAFLMLRDRLGGDDADRGDSPSSSP